MRHAQAAKATVELRVHKDELVLTVADDGVGFDEKRVARLIQEGKSFGLIAMRERSLLVGGTLEIESGKGQGTAIRVRMPVRGSAKGRLLQSA